MKTFQFIKDTRFSNTPQKDVIDMTARLERDIFDLAILTVYPIHEIVFDSGEIISYRRAFRIAKRKGYKWDDLFTVINKIQAPVYKNL